MNNTFLKETKHPVKGKWEEAIWYADFYAPGYYGVVFPSDIRGRQTREHNQRIAFDPERITLEVRDSESRNPLLPRKYNRKLMAKSTMKNPSRTKMAAKASAKNSGSTKLAVKQGQGYAKGGKAKSGKK